MVPAFLPSLEGIILFRLYYIVFVLCCQRFFKHKKSRKNKLFPARNGKVSANLPIEKAPISGGL